MIHRLLVVAFGCLLAGMGAGCGQRDTPAGGETGRLAANTPSAGHAQGDGTTSAPDAAAVRSIAWHEGDVASAFERARREGKPLFLYWGAAWCPPCNEIKATIFSRPEFIEKSRLFVAVYLDGDTARAQEHGDAFKVMGYPTMIVFDSRGNEITRIPGGLDIGLYGRVLDLTLNDVRPVGNVVDAVLAGRPVSDDDFRLLAFYSWGQDNEQVLADRDRLETYRAMATSCPERLAAESARLYVAYVMSAIAAAGDEENPRPLEPGQKAEALARVQLILDDDDLSHANLPMVLHYADEIVAGLTDPETAERDRLVDLWSRRLDVLEADERLSTAYRLTTMLTRIEFVKLDDDEAQASPALRRRARQLVAWADTSASTPYQRQTVVNTAWYVLSEAGLDEEATALLTAELEKSKQPYYFMLDLADLAKEAGREDEAVAWLARAYDEAEGPATRFQWGYNYVIGLLEMKPEDGDRIEAAAIEVLSELDDPNNAIYNRTERILNRLSGRLLEWNESGRFDLHLARVRDKATTICSRVSMQEKARQTCDAFLVEPCPEPGPRGGRRGAGVGETCR